MIQQKETLFDATWTSSGNIVYTTNSNKVVVIIASLGQNTTIVNNMKEPKYLTVSNDDVMFIAALIFDRRVSVDG